MKRTCGQCQHWMKDHKGLCMAQTCVCYMGEDVTACERFVDRDNPKGLVCPSCGSLVKISWTRLGRCGLRRFICPICGDIPEAVEEA